MKNFGLDVGYNVNIFTNTRYRLNHGAGLSRSKGAKFRQEVFYDEDVEECFTFRDSQNNKVDDIIEIMSSDDDMQITTITPPRKSKLPKKKSFPKIIDKICAEQLEHILAEVVETEVCVMADSEIFYNLEDPGWDEELKELASLEL